MESIKQNQEQENMDEEMKAIVDSEVAKIDGYSQALLDRVGKIDLIHEDLIIIEKIDVRSMKSLIFMVENSRFDRLKNSYYGRILKISEMDSMDEVKEAKKKRLKVGDIITFNPDVGYSLNVIVPEEMPEIWVIGVENVLGRDNGFNPMEAKRKTIIANVTIARRNAAIQQEELRKEHERLRRAGSPNIHQ